MGSEFEFEEEEIYTQLLHFLPVHLEELHITHAQAFWPTLIPALQILLDRRADRLPRLVKVTLEAPFKDFWLWSYRLVNEQMPVLIELIARSDIPILALDDTRKNPKGEFLEYFERAWGMDEDIKWAEVQYGTNRRPARSLVDIKDLDHKWSVETARSLWKN